MKHVTITREIDAPPEVVRERMADREAFMQAGGFSDVTVEGDEIHLENTVGIFLVVELELDIVDRPDAEFAYVQRSGIFREMETTFTVTPIDSGDRTRVSASTDFEIDVDFAGPLLDASVVRRKRRLELERQFDYLEG